MLESQVLAWNNHIKTMTYDVGKPGPSLEQSHKDHDM